MIALDTNVLVRYIVRDDPPQTAVATHLIDSACTKESPGLVCLVVLCELVWVLERGYEYGRAEIAEVIRKILTADELTVERPQIAWRSLGLYEQGRADFADYVIGLSNKASRAESTFTFDRKTAGCDLFTQLPLRARHGRP